MRVLDRQRVQVELRLHRSELLRGRIPERNPDEAFRPADVSADLARLDIGELAAVLVGNAVDEHGSSPGPNPIIAGGRAARAADPHTHHIAPMRSAGAPSLSIAAVRPHSRPGHQLPESSAVARRQRVFRALVRLLQMHRQRAWRPGRRAEGRWGRRAEGEMPTTLIDAEPEAISIDPARTAVLVIDMQRDFLEPGGFGETLGNDVSLLSSAIGPCKALLEGAQAPRHADRPHPRRPPARSVRCTQGQGRARRTQRAHRRARAHGPHPDPRRGRPRHRARALSPCRASR